MLPLADNVHLNDFLTVASLPDGLTVVYCMSAADLLGIWRARCWYCFPHTFQIFTVCTFFLTLLFPVYPSLVSAHLPLHLLTQLPTHLPARMCFCHPSPVAGGHALDVQTCQECVTSPRPPGTRPSGWSLLALPGTLGRCPLQAVLQVRAAECG